MDQAHPYRCLARPREGGARGSLHRSRWPPCLSYCSSTMENELLYCSQSSIISEDVNLDLVLVVAPKIRLRCGRDDVPKNSPETFFPELFFLSDDDDRHVASGTQCKARHPSFHSKSNTTSTFDSLEVLIYGSQFWDAGCPPAWQCALPEEDHPQLFRSFNTMCRNLQPSLHTLKTEFPASTSL